MLGAIELYRFIFQRNFASFCELHQLLAGPCNSIVSIDSFSDVMQKKKFEVDLQARCECSSSANAEALRSGLALFNLSFRHTA
jgi:hypothetical protein